MLYYLQVGIGGGLGYLRSEATHKRDEICKCLIRHLCDYIGWYLAFTTISKVPYYLRIQSTVKEILQAFIGCPRVLKEETQASPRGANPSGSHLPVQVLKGWWLEPQSIKSAEVIVGYGENLSPITWRGMIF
jgi:hypothetical protein